MNFVSFTSESISLLKPIKNGFLAKSVHHSVLGDTSEPEQTLQTVYIVR